MKVEKELKNYGIRPVDGQNFLRSEAVVEALVQAGEVEDNRVLEIGAGTGIITEKLLEQAEFVNAVEKDSKLVELLNDKLQSRENLEIIEGDILNIEWPEVDRCVANLPFQISSEVIEKLGEKQIQSSLIFQEELANRLIAEPGDSNYGRLSVLANYYFIPVKLRTVSAEHYHPKPEVDTAIVKLYPNKQRHGVDDEEFFFKLTKALFTHKRKKVRNAFVDARHILEIDKDQAKDLRDLLPHSEKRVVNLNIKELKEISNNLQQQDLP